MGRLGHGGRTSSETFISARVSPADLVLTKRGISKGAGMLGLTDLESGEVIGEGSGGVSGLAVGGGGQMLPHGRAAIGLIGVTRTISAGKVTTVRGGGDRGWHPRGRGSLSEDETVSPPSVWSRGWAITARSMGSSARVSTKRVTMPSVLTVSPRGTPI